MIGSAVRFFQEGGFFMYLILFAMSVGTAIAIERFLFLRNAVLFYRAKTAGMMMAKVAVANSPKAMLTTCCEAFW